MRKLFIISILLPYCLVLGSSFVYLNSARIAYRDRDYERAKTNCLKGIEIDPNNFEFHVILGGSEIGLGNWQAGSDALINAFTIDSVKTMKWISEKGGGEQYFYQAFYFSARELFDREKYVEVLKNLDYAELLDPADIRTYILRGATLYKLGKWEETNKEYKKALNIDPENPDVSFLIGRSLFESKNFEGSLTYFSDAEKHYSIPYNRMSRLIFQNLSEIDKELAKKIIILWIEHKLEELDQLIKKDLGFEQGLDVQKINIEQYCKATDDLGRNYYYIGMAYYNLQKDSLALENLLKSLELKPNDLDILFYTGELLIRFKKYERAIEHLERLTQLKEDDVHAWFYLGVCYTQLKKYKKAIDIYENKVLVLDPENIEALTNLAYVLGEIGNKDKALEILLKIEKLEKK